MGAVVHRDGPVRLADPVAPSKQPHPTLGFNAVRPLERRDSLL